VGKYTTSGGVTNAAFIPEASIGFGSGSGTTPRGVAVAGSNLYVTSHDSLGGDAIGKFKTSGTIVNSKWVSGSALSNPWGVVLPRTVGDLQNPVLTGQPQTLDSDAVVTAVLSRPGTVNGFTYTNDAILVQDKTGSLEIFAGLSGLGYTPAVGDQITATGTYTTFGQIPELTSVTEVSRFSSGNAAAGPVTATIPDLNHTTMPLGAPAPPAVGEYLFTLNDVTITGAPATTWGHGATGSAANESMTITDGNGNSMTLFYWPSSYSVDGEFYGTAIPTGPVNITGFVSVFGNAQFTPVSITPAPEPGCFAILGVSGAMLVCARQRRALERKWNHF